MPTICGANEDYRGGHPLSGVSPVNVEAEFDDLDDADDMWG
nr:MAG TPA: hypothetical protein [Caudoviricetes sp.]